MGDSVVVVDTMYVV